VQPALDSVVLDHGSCFHKASGDAPTVFSIVPTIFTCTI
jgi:hypothetical protein